MLVSCSSHCVALNYSGSFILKIILIAAGTPSFVPRSLISPPTSFRSFTLISLFPIYYEGLYHQLRHLRLITGINGYVSSIGGQQLVRDSSHADVRLLTKVIQPSTKLQ